jgi:hypothetical protein
VKAIKHSHHGTVLRLDNESAHLLVGSGKWVYISKFEARDAALNPRRHMWKRVLLVTAWVVAMLFALALVGANAAQARPCESLAQVQKKHTGQYPKYRSVDGRKCWYVGKRVPAKSEFSLPATASSRGGVKNTHGWKVESSKQPFSVERCQGHQVLESFKPKAGCAGSIPAALSPRETNHAGEPTALTAVEVPSGRSGSVTSRSGVPQTRRDEPAPDDPHRTAYSVTFEHDAILAACGMPCPQLMAFEDRWDITMGKRR